MVCRRISLGIQLSLNLNPSSDNFMNDSEPQFSHLLNWSVNITEFRGLWGNYLRLYILLAWYLQIMSAQSLLAIRQLDLME